MKRDITIMALAAIGMFLAAGCRRGDMLNQGLAPSQCTSRTLGDASYQQAYVAGRQVLSQYFPIDAAKSSADVGVVKSRPKEVRNAGRDRLLGDSPARQIATLQVIQEGPVVTARVQVLQQREGSSTERQMGYSQERHSYTMNPGDTGPGNMDAATTPQQNETWTNEKRRRDLEGQILDDLYRQLHGK
ncbi:MAG: hypothetical protein JW849_05680 [Phycisphaerae bacterium]|nr:hypothetical protein [Phycisphaerae bacterium]